ncbi:MAG TPA: amino acid permease, partial [Roseiarcus sp.]|nr:amino acid permease [Roseiarcus sp.]
GFGDCVGFLSAFGYWLGSVLGNVFYWVLIGTTLGRFFPEIFGDGTSVVAIVVSLIGVWAFHFMILRGVKEATFINKVVTVAKIVPLILAVLIFVFFFHYAQFFENFFGGVGMPEKSLVAQVRDTMLITVFVFIGIEGASVYSRYAEKRSDVGAATILGFVGVTGLMVAITLLPYATAPRASIAGVQNPSLAGALELVVGHWGAVMISIGVLVSVLGAFLAWTLICAEVLFAAGKSQDMPRLFASQNSNEVPANALWLSNIVVSLFVISTYWSRDAFNFMLDMASVTSLLPYLLVAGYGVLLARSGVGYEKTPNERGRDQVFAAIAVVYTIFMFIAAGLKYVLLLTVLLAPGTILYFWARREQNAKLFTWVELTIFVVALIAAAIGVYGLATGLITP